MAEKKGKKLELSALAIADNIVYSEKEAWAYYRVGNRPFDFLSNDGKIGVAAAITQAISNIMTESNVSIDCHIINTSTPLDVDAWEKQIWSEITEGREPPGAADYIREQKYYLQEQAYNIKVSYFGICLGKRGALEASSINFFEAGFKGAWDEINKWSKKALALPSGEISKSEEKKFSDIEKNYYTIIGQGNLQAERVSAEEILLLIKRQFYPAMPAPYLDVDHDSRLGEGDLALETYSGIKNRYRWLEITQQFYQYEVTGYRAAMTFSKFPREMRYPMGIPFLYLPNRMREPYTTYARFTLLPTQEMKKEVQKKQKELIDEQANAADAGGYDALSSGSDTFEAMADSATMDSILSGDKTPWVQGTYRIVIESLEEQDLKEQISIVKQEYADMDINVTHTAGDQAKLFLEQMPGDYLREKSFQQTTNLYHIGASGFNFNSSVGDKVSGGELK